MKKIFAFLTSLSVGQFAFSQDADSTKKPALPVVITGSLDAYYRFNFNNPKTTPYNSLTSFTRSTNSFELGMASIRADHSFGKVSATVDLGFGRRAEEFAYNDANTLLAVKQMYISYSPVSALKLTAGTWATHVGYELPDAYLNRNYSMSYMFTNSPFSHTGLKADISLGGKTSLMLGISNSTDFRTAPGLPKSFIAQFSTGSKNNKLKAYLNFVGGRQNDYKKVVQGDMVATYLISDKFSLGFEGSWQSIKAGPDSTGSFTSYQWEGAALYLNADPMKWFGLTLRTEYIRDQNEYLGLKRAFASTLSANFKVDNLVIIPEFRFDNTGNRLFFKNATETINSTCSLILAAAYHF